MNLYIDGYSLTIENIVSALKGELGNVIMSIEAEKNCRESRKQINRWLVKDGPVVYGVNTGLGNLKDTALSPEEHLNWNKTIPYPHAVGMGELLGADITRAALLIRANVLCRAYSAVRPELIYRMLDIFNNKIAPAVVEYGSTGLSDLPPLAQCAMVVAGLDEAEVIYNGEIRKAKEVFKEVGLAEEFPLECKEVLAQMNGSTVTQSIAVLACYNIEKIINLQYELEKSFIGYIKEQQYKDIFSALTFAKNIINFENNISCDNPLLFEKEDGSFEPVMGCNCSNTQVGYVLDMLNMIIADCGDLVCEHMDSLKSNNLKLAGLYSNCLGLLNELKNMCMLVSADSIPTKANQEDHVEFSYQAAMKALKASEKLKRLVANLIYAKYITKEQADILANKIQSDELSGSINIDIGNIINEINEKF